MAQCDQGYLCAVCGEEVETLAESDLYLRFVLGEVDPETLHVAPERHIKCNPTLAQFIVSDGFVTPQVDGPFGKSALDSKFVAEEEARVTRGFDRLKALARTSRDRPITDYLSPEAAARWSRPAGVGEEER